MKNNRNRTVLIVLLAAALVAANLSGCSMLFHSHTFAKAGCEEPAACSCGKTQGEALGHNWQEATCTAPKFCSRCGLTAGQALGHQLQPATVEKPETCSLCGHTQGRSLGALLTSYPVQEDSNDNDRNRDVTLGAWMDFAGNLYTDALRFWVIDKNGWNDSEYIDYRLDGKFKELELTTAAEKNSAQNTSTKIMVYADGQLIYETGWQTRSTSAEKVTLDITGCKVLRILCTTDSGDFCYGLAHGTLYN